MRPRAAIFCLHDIVPPERLDAVPVTHRPYALDPEEFRTLVTLATSSGRAAIVVSQIPQAVGASFYAFTFDDGAESDYAIAFPVLGERGIRATFFIVPTLVGTPGFATWGQLREMVAAGMEIGSHSMTHPFVHRLDRAGLLREFGDSKRVLEDRLGLPVHSASLPRGWAPPGLRPVLEELGYRTFCTSRVTWWHPGGDRLDIPRIGIQRGMDADEFAGIVAAAPRALWRLQAVEAAKNAAKACLGSDRWQDVRASLLALRERV
jgi:peptidoglycan/xylan/chitin deacetylase (PgdA/CDA1 family)